MWARHNLEHPFCWLSNTRFSRKDLPLVVILVAALFCWPLPFSLVLWQPVSCFRPLRLKITLLHTKTHSMYFSHKHTHRCLSGLTMGTYPCISCRPILLARVRAWQLTCSWSGSPAERKWAFRQNNHFTCCASVLLLQQILCLRPYRDLFVVFRSKAAFIKAGLTVL